MDDSTEYKKIMGRVPCMLLSSGSPFLREHEFYIMTYLKIHKKWAVD
jgi:hypothetical protein